MIVTKQMRLTPQVLPHRLLYQRLNCRVVERSVHVGLDYRTRRGHRELTAAYIIRSAYNQPATLLVLIQKTGVMVGIAPSVASRAPGKRRERAASTLIMLMACGWPRTRTEITEYCCGGAPQQRQIKISRHDCWRDHVSFPLPASLTWSGYQLCTSSRSQIPSRISTGQGAMNVRGGRSSIR